MRSRFFVPVGAALVCALFAAGCADGHAIVTAPSMTSEQLAATWTVVAIQPTGGSETPAPAGASYTVNFNDGRLSGRLDCNTCTGAFALSGSILTIGPALACTRAACATMSFGNAYASILSGDSTVTLSDRTLVLSSPRGVLRFTR